ncbi:hypothetical protein [Miniphocaeibacter massiliensis]|uniref:hypothetical protein n=1 Tax=Miniphocaeibacter massiliensis TaxID=2041841 RepID=UPI000C067F8F|nr:hypothetical protein [Miniphocaeibacter massiliensis]
MKETLILTLSITFVLFTFFTVRFFVKYIFSKPIADSLQDGSTFYLEDDGKFALWARARNRKMNKLLVESPVILNNRDETVDFSRSIGNMTTSSPKYSSVKLGSFVARAGSYKLKTINKPFSIIGRIIPKSNNELVEVEYIIKKNFSLALFFFAIWAIILAAFSLLLNIFIITGVIPIS